METEYPEGGVVSLVSVSVAGDPVLLKLSVKVTESVMVPSPKPLKSIPEI